MSISVSLGQSWSVVQVVCLFSLLAIEIWAVPRLALCTFSLDVSCVDGFLVVLERRYFANVMFIYSQSKLQQWLWSWFPASTSKWVWWEVVLCNAKKGRNRQHWDHSYLSAALIPPFLLPSKQSITAFIIIQSTLSGEGIARSFIQERHPTHSTLDSLPDVLGGWEGNPIKLKYSRATLYRASSTFDSPNNWCFSTQILYLIQMDHVSVICGFHPILKP